jgi:diadenosine tetraphosphatase ApaH/serine/threonine PP2A family protein phosphatase
MEQNWVQISGNHDRQLITQNPIIHGLSDRYAFNVLNDSEKEWLRQLPANVQMDENTLLFHGTPSSDTEYFLETVQHGRAALASRSEIKKRLGNTRYPLMLCGHSHVQRIVEIDENIVIVNPGSVGLPAYKDELPEPHIIESGSPHARYAILLYDDTWTVELISVMYDFQEAADRARKNNRPDWAIALQTGCMTQ